MRLKMAFVGSALGLFGYMLLATFSFYLLLIPGAWGLVAFYQWMARNTQVSDGSTVDFTGTPIEFLKLLLITISVPFLIALIIAASAQRGINPTTGQPYPDFMAFVAFMYLIIFAWSFFWGFKILKWGIASVRFGWGGQLEFTGGMFAYIGWILLTYIGALFFVLPAFWVMSAMFRWMAEKTKSSTGDRLVWVGSGWELLWRSIVAYLGCIFIIPIPWVMRWYLAWMISMHEIERAGGGTPMAYAPAPAAPPQYFPPPAPPAPPVNPGGGRYGGLPPTGSGSSGPGSSEPGSSGPAPTSGSNDPGLWGPG